MTSTRRLAAILVADVVGYSRLMEADEAGTLAALKERRKTILEPVVKEHGGRVVKLMGDGVLVEFASAVEAVKAAITLQQSFEAANTGVSDARHVRLRIGVNLGDVIGEGSDIYGDGVNIAARLENLAQPGGICISGKVRDEINRKVSCLIEEVGETVLRNIGEPVRVYRVAPTADEAGRVSGASADRARTSIVVLPFVNMSGDAAQEYFSDGLTEDLTTELSRYRHLSVTARNTAFVYKGRAVSVPEIGRQLGVDFVVEGSVRYAGGRVRITVQLIDAHTGTHVWAEKFDRALDDIFALQDEVIGQIIARFSFGLDEAAGIQRGRSPTTNTTAYTLFLRARAAWRNGEERTARGLLQDAIELDPKYARAIAYLAYFYSYGVFSQTTALPDEEAAKLAREYIQKAIELDRGDPFMLHRIAMTYTLLGETSRARRFIELAAAQNPRDLDVMVVHGMVLGYCGEYEQELKLLEQVGRLESRMPPGYRWALSDVCYMAGDYARAASEIENIIEPVPFMKICQAACLAQMGQLAEARRLVEDASKTIDAARLVRIHVAMCVLPEDRDRWLEGFRKAGVAVEFT